MVNQWFASKGIERVSQEIIRHQLTQCSGDLPPVGEPIAFDRQRGYRELLGQHGKMDSIFKFGNALSANICQYISDLMSPITD